MSTPLVIALLALPVLVWRVWVGLKLPEKRVRDAARRRKAAPPR